MKNLFAFTAALVLLVAFAGPAAAQPAIRAEIPFAFMAGNQLLPAGEYEFTVDTDHMLSRIMPVAGGEVRLVRLVPGVTDRSWSQSENGLLRFQKFGERYVLSGIWRAGSTAGKTVVGHKPPRELAKHADGVREVVTQ